MIKYREEDKIIQIRKLDIDDSVLGSPLDNIRAAYNKYIEETIHSDFRFFETEIKKAIEENENKDWYKVEIVDSTPTNRYRETSAVASAYRSWDIVFYYFGEPFHREELLKMPLMETDGTLNFEGKKKTLVWEQVSSQSISYDEKKDTLRLQLKECSINFIFKSGKIKFQINKLAEHDAVTFLRKMLLEEGSRVMPSDILVSPLARHIMKDIRYASSDAALVGKEYNEAYKYLRSDKALMTDARESLYNAIRFSDHMGEKLSRDIEVDGVIIANKGDEIKKELLRTLKGYNIQEIYVRKKPVVKSLPIAQDLIVQKAKRNTKITNLLTSILVPGEKPYIVGSYLTEDTPIVKSFQNFKGLTLTDDVLDFLYSNEITDELAVFMDTKNIDTIRFEQEIILADKEGEYLTARDFSALMSALLRIKTYRDNRGINNRDLDFLKDIRGIDTTFSKYLRQAMVSTIRQVKRNLIHNLQQARAASSSNNRKQNFLYGVKDSFLSLLNNKSTLLREVESLNPISLLSHINRISNIFSKDANISKDIKTIKSAYFSRICPYETPSSKKIGLVNNIALGCKIIDGKPLAPYYKVQVNENGTYVDRSKIHYLSVLEEHQYKIGDILTLKFRDENYDYFDVTEVLAKVPSKTLGEEKMSAQMIKSSELNYVTVHPEQHCSSTVALIPFAGATDGARISFSTSLIKQALPLVDGHPANVITPFWRTMLDSSEAFLLRAEKDGYIDAVKRGVIHIQYDDDYEHYAAKSARETEINQGAIITRNFKKSPGERVSKGDIIMDSSIARGGILTIGNPLLVAHIPDDGYNYEDAISMSVLGARKFTSLTSKKQSFHIKFGNNTKEHINYSLLDTFVDKGQPIADIKEVNTKIVRNSIKAEHSGVFNNVSTVNDLLQNRKKITMQFITYSHLETGDKMSGLHGDKGTISRIVPNSMMPQFKNGVTIEAVINPCGTVSRMNLGKQLEGHLGFIAYMLNRRIEVGAFNCATREEVNRLMHFVWDASNNTDFFNFATKYYGTELECLLPLVEENWENIQDWKGAFYPDGTAEMYNPETGTYFENPIVFGMPYFLKEVHEVDNKVHGRAGLLENEAYSAIYKMPTKGAAYGGGQALGEMEMSVIAAHGATSFIEECFNVKADNYMDKLNMAMDLLGVDDAEKLKYSKEYTHNYTIDMLRYYLNTIGLEFDFDPEIPVMYKNEELEEMGIRLYNINMLKENKIKEKDLEVEVDTSAFEDMLLGL